MKKIAISVLVLLALVLVSCADSMDTSDVLAARAAAEGDIKWNASYASDSNIIKVIPLKSDRSNASGKGVTKITSNAHSADCKDVYFRWENKQKDDGILLVKKEVFDTYLGFTLTTKVSNTYWDFPITIYGEDGKKIEGISDTDGLYIFSVPKGKQYKEINKAGDLVFTNGVGCDKNINMVFIGNWKLIKEPIKTIYGDTEEASEYVISFTKVVTDKNFGKVPFELWAKDAKKFSFTVTYKGAEGTFSKVVTFGDVGTAQEDDGILFNVTVPFDGPYTIEEAITGTDMYKAEGIKTYYPTKATKTISLISKASDGGVKEVSNKFEMNGVGILDIWKNGLEGFNETFGNAKFIWDTEETYLYGVTGSAIIHYSTTFTLTDAELAAIDSFPVNFAADNAAVMFVNGTRVGYTKEAISLENIDIIEKDGFTDFSNEAFLGSAWQHIYTVNIADALVSGKNEVVFYAANSDTNGGLYDVTNNPCGLIFFGEVTIETGTGNENEFVNEKVVGADVIKMEDGKEKGREKSGGAKTGTTGIENNSIDGSKVSEGTSWFTVARLADLEEGVWTTCQVVNGNNGNTKYDIVGQVFVQKDGDDLNVVIDGTGATYHLQMLDVAPIGDNGQKDAKSGSGSVFTVPYKANLYLKVTANFYRF